MKRWNLTLLFVVVACLGACHDKQPDCRNYFDGDPRSAHGLPDSDGAAFCDTCGNLYICNLTGGEFKVHDSDFPCSCIGDNGSFDTGSSACRPHLGRQAAPSRAR